MWMISCSQIAKSLGKHVENRFGCDNNRTGLCMYIQQKQLS
jgi:hypothetical protein